MPLTSIVTILLRLTSLSWFVQSLGMFAAARPVFPSSFASPTYWNYAPPVLMLIAAVTIFLLSRPLAKMVTPRPVAEVSLGGLSLYDLYCFAFTFLGLYFVLASLASTLTWLHYFTLIARATPENDPQRESSFYQLAQPLITLVAGGACLLFAPRCARRLAEIQRKNESA